MKKTFLLAALAASLTASAEVLTPAQALMRLEQEAGSQNSPAVRRMAASNARVAMPIQTISNAAGEPQIYFFADGNNGLMLVSAESEAEALIGYTEAYTPGDAIPPAMQYMIDCYAAEIEALRAGAVTFTSEAAFDLNSPAIEPICTTQWDQGAPYNDMCPSISGQLSVTGCVATAMAQVLKTYEYPSQCSGGTFSYTWGSNNNSTLSMNFDEVVLNWDEMADRYSSSESAPAVAELMKALGYSSQMDYSPYGSGTFGSYMAMGLIRNFGYDCTVSHELREWYPLGQWMQMVYDVLQSGHAVYYDGANPDNSAAHAFVVDGYRGDGFFHLNWGWGGVSDGYFRLTALDPSAQGIGGSTAGYDRGQGAIFNMIPGATTDPADAPIILFMNSGFKAATTSATLPSAVSFRSPKQGAVYNHGPNTISSCNLAVKFTKSTGEEVYYHTNNTMSNIAPFYGYTCTFSVTLNNKLTEGTYTVSPAVYNPKTGEYFDVRYPVGIGATFTAEVSGNIITFSSPETAVLVAEELTVDETIYQDTSFKFAAKLINQSSEEYYGPVVAKLYSRGSSTAIADLGSLVVSAAASETVNIEVFFRIKSSTADVGEYDIALIDQYGNVISEAKPITLEAKLPEGTPKCTRIQCTNKAKNNLTFKLTLRTSNHSYTNPVYVVLTEYGSSSSLVYFASPIVTITPDESTVVEIVGDFAAGETGQKYTAYPFYLYDGTSLVQMAGNAVSFTLEEPTAIEEIEDTTDAPVEYYDLAGRRVIEPKSGIYIRKQGSEVSKVKL